MAHHPRPTMKIKGSGSPFAEDLLTQLPVNYRYMAQIETHTFVEHHIGVRFSSSQPHQSRAFRLVELYKPVSTIIYQDYF